MDEPYSAVDPIVRLRLQDELIALQRRVRKTIVFVTHDIDEAIKLADQVALLDVGGVLAQFGPPDELLRAPASPFVESFLGNERALRRLALRTRGRRAARPVAAIAARACRRSSNRPRCARRSTRWSREGVPTVIVTDDDGKELGSLDVVRVAAALHEGH